MAKLLVWSLALVGLAPAVIVAIFGLLALREADRAGAPRRYGTGSGGHLSEMYLMFGSWRLDLNPQYWSITLLFLGVAMVVAALFAMLRPVAF